MTIILWLGCYGDVIWRRAGRLCLGAQYTAICCSLTPVANPQEEFKLACSSP
jgi:hypothetical protein